jgi:hypothetical protein
VKVGDLVKYIDPRVEQNIGMALRIYNSGSRELVEILWSDGDIVTHHSEGFKVISESR